MGAVRFVRSRGAKDVFLIGASMGGEGVILAASKLGADVVGVISLSASEGLVGLLDPEVEAGMVASIDVPNLFVAGEMDQSFADAARDFFAHAKQPKELRLFPLGDHGVALLHSAQGAQVQDLIFDFLTSNGPGG
jgi:pimeloyl-ACP methyl ester carboxylesterase